ncbi:MAG: class I SAM-dependent methyltransferase [bacterium]
MSSLSLSPAARAFDAVAERFDERYGAWLSVSAQRRAVRASLVRAFPPRARVLEIGGGTGEDAVWLTEHGREVLLTDVSPSMVRIAETKLRPYGAPQPIVVGAEGLAALADARDSARQPLLDGAFTNFAALNCVHELAPVAAGLARLVRPGGKILLVIFGVCSPGEWLVQLVRRDVRAAFRRMSRGDVSARLGGQHFLVRYHRGADVDRAFAPWFAPVGRRGIGIFVPPSAAEPWISGHRRLLSTLEKLDRVVAGPLSFFGDHVLYELERTAVSSRPAGVNA